eukprot:1187639-Prorocentrum_minimum.AAC.5
MNNTVTPKRGLTKLVPVVLRHQIIASQLINLEKPQAETISNNAKLPPYYGCLAHSMSSRKRLLPLCSRRGDTSVLDFGRPSSGFWLLAPKPFQHHQTCSNDSYIGDCLRSTTKRNENSRKLGCTRFH